jgi:hypothetical protein
MLPVSLSYMPNTLDAKSRNMVRKSQKLNYVFKAFKYNDYLEDIYEVNISKSVRQGRPMTAGYLTPPPAIGYVDKLCYKHQYMWFGMFDQNDTLRSYCALALVNEIAIINTIIGHGEYLPDGIMNGLIHGMVMYCLTTPVEYMNYLTLEDCGPGLRRFKESVGFESMRVSFV